MSPIPYIPSMTVTQPAALDDQPLHILPHRTREELGVCQGRGDCGCQRPASSTPPEAGNVWFVGTEPNDDETAFDTGWPLTGREVLAFWITIFAASAVVVSLILMVTGWANGLSTRDIIGTVLAWGA